MTGGADENSVRWERAVLACVLLGGDWDEVRSLSIDDFSLGDHKKIFAAMSRLSGTNDQADTTLLLNELGANSTAAATVIDLTADGTVGTKLPRYVQELKRASVARECNRLYERFPDASAEEKREIVRQMDVLLSRGVSSTSTGAVRVLSDVETQTVDWLWEPYIP